MNSAVVSKLDVIWFQRRDYKVISLNPLLSTAVENVEREIERGVWVKPDSNRLDFYDLHLHRGWAYIHVRDKIKTVYVVGYRSGDVAFWKG
jgi:hypothetical protein